MSLRIAHISLLQALARLDLATAEQLTRLLFSAGSASYVRSNLVELKRQELLQSWPLSTTTSGKPPYVYALTRKGLGVVAESGVKVPRTPIRRRGEPTDLLLRHSLAVVDCLIEFELMAQKGRMSIQRIFNERQLRSSPLIAKPDCWIETATHCYWIEVDRDSERLERIAFKAKRIVECYRTGQYEEYFGTDVLSVILVAPSEARMVRLENMVLTALQGAGYEEWIPYFIQTTDVQVLGGVM